MKEPASRTRRKPATSKHYTLEEIAPGVWAAIHKPGGWAIGNAGIIDLGDRVLVFDAFMTPQAAFDLREAVVALTGKPPNAVILSHRHSDHIFGARTFAPHADLIATVQTQHWIAAHGRAQIDAYRDTVPGRLRELESATRKAKSSPASPGDGSSTNQPNNLSAWLDYYRGLSASLSQLEVPQPNLTFEDALDLHGKGGIARLLTFSGGHTESDTILFLPEQGVVFMGDLLFNGSHPYLAEGEPSRMHSIHKEILGLGAQIFVPGHGPVGYKAEIEKQIKYIDRLIQLANRAIEQGQSVEKLAKTAIPKAYAEWSFPEYFSQNLQAFYEKARRSPSELPPSEP